MPPAARITDLHTCPKPAHVGGPISSGAATVLIGHQPAARVGDTAICVPATDAIAAGAANVIIEHRPAARIGDATEHGAVIVTGCPTVIIGTTAQSSTLIGAAANGAPFCEECERARRAAEAAARGERPPEAETDAEPPPDAVTEPAAQGSAEAGGETSSSAPTQDEQESAAAPGNTLEQRAAREKVVRDFYGRNAHDGLGQARADQDLGVFGRAPRPNLHPKGFGIDLSRPVAVVSLPETLSQVVPKGALPGNVFDPRGSALGEALGLGAPPGGERLRTFLVSTGEGLLSTSGPFRGLPGGAPQLLVPDSVRRAAACVCCGAQPCRR